MEVEKRISRHALILLMKYVPVANALLMLVHVSLLLLGVNLGQSELVSGTPILATSVILIASYAFGFCWLHRAFVCYSAIVYACIYFQRWHDFGVLLTPMRWCAFWAGTLLFVILAIKFKPYSHGCIK